MLREDNKSADAVVCVGNKTPAPASSSRSPCTSDPSPRGQARRSRGLTVTSSIFDYQGTYASVFSPAAGSGLSITPNTQRRRVPDLGEASLATAAVLYHAYLFWAVFRTWYRSTDWCHGTRLLAAVTLVIYAALFARLSVHFASKRFSSQVEVLSLAIHRRPAIITIAWAVLVLLVLSYSFWKAWQSPRSLVSIAGATIFLGTACVFSYNKRRIVWADVFRAIVTHYVTSAFLLNWDAGFTTVDCVAGKFTDVVRLTRHGAAFTFQHLSTGLKLTELLGDLAQGHNVTDLKSVFGFRIVSSYFFWGLIIHLAYWYEFTREVIFLLSRCFRQLTGASICEGIAAMASMFLSSSMTLLTVEPYVNVMTLGELFTTMTLGFSTVAAGRIPVMARLSGNQKHVENSVVLSVLAALLYAKIVYPECETVTITVTNFPPPRRREHSGLETASAGSVKGLRIAGLVLAALICMNFLIKGADALFSWICANVGMDQASIQWVAGEVMVPVSFLLGVSWRDCRIVGPIIAKKIVANEYVAFKALSLIKDKEFEERSRVLTTYAACSFGNLAEIGAIVGTLEILRKVHVERVMALALPALATGCVVNLYNACIVGIFIS